MERCLACEADAVGACGGHARNSSRSDAGVASRRADPYGLASEAALHNQTDSPVSPFRLTPPIVKLRIRAQENHTNNYPGFASG